MGVFAVIGTAILIVLVALVAIFVRREVISRAGGTIDMNIRLSTFAPERGWAPGLGRFVGDDLRWYRMFSFGFRPRRVLSRQDLVVAGRRRPDGGERLAMPEGWIIVHCYGHTGAHGHGGAAGQVEIALAESALMGFLSWLEAAPPGARRRQ
jgi:hypothetical protein